jgi:ketosteroid isomerase-like protein
MKLRLLPATLLLLLLAACASRYIGSTRIPDTPDTRELLQLMDRYRAALEARNAQAIVEMVSPNFSDTLGTETPADDLFYKDLPQTVSKDLEKLDDTRVQEINVLRVEVQGDKASAIYRWNISWRMPRFGGKPQSASDLEQMTFEKVDGKWKILSGI